LEKDRFGYGDLIEIIRRLRDPDGCPWDRAQSPSSIRTNILEEAYELVEAVDLHDEAKIREECGDVLLQSAFLSVMTEEKGSVTNIDVISELCRN
jgi:tetrapyrrole methylase family protein/MazG family protein